MALTKEKIHNVSLETKFALSLNIMNMLLAIKKGSWINQTLLAWGQT
jgi:hypothetical protein